MLAEYETTLGTATLENIAIKNVRNSDNKVSYKYVGPPTQADHNQEDEYFHTNSLFCLVVLARENLRKSSLLLTYRNQVFLYFNF